MMLQPCSNCPFRSDRPFKALSEARCKEIVAVLYSDGGFHCHKTLDYSNGEPKITRESTLCIGSMLFLENTRRGGIVANLTYRLDVIYKGLKAGHLSREIPVYSSVRAFIRGASL